MNDGFELDAESPIANRHWCLLLAVILLAGCAALPQPEISPVAVDVPADFPFSRYLQRPPGQVFSVDQSELVIKTYRAGWLKGLAHSHVLTASTLNGLIFLDPAGRASMADLYFRPYDLVLDDPQARAAAGPEFESIRTESDVAATRLRMLGPRLLDSNDHPFIRIHVAPGPAPGEVLLSIVLRSQTTTRLMPVEWSDSAERLEVRASFRLTHAELGLKPYSAFAGALAVAEPVDVMVALRASVWNRATQSAQVRSGSS